MSPLNNKGINEMNELDCLRALVARPASTGGGGASISDPNVAWFSATGNATTGNGTPSNPYGPNNGQKAFDAGFRSFRIGSACDIGNMSATGNTVSLAFFGAGLGAACDTLGFNQTDQVISLFVDGFMSFGNITADGPSGDALHLDGYSGNALTISICPSSQITQVSSLGGNAFDDGGTSANGGSGGVVTVIGGGKVGNNPAVTGGNAVNAGIPGAAGSVAVAGAYIGGTFYTNTFI